MRKLSIRAASQYFGLSRARIYQLLSMGKIAGYRSSQKGCNASSWVDASSLSDYLKTKPQRAKKRSPGPKLVRDGNYIAVREAAQKTGYCVAQIYNLARRGSIAARKPDSGRGWLVHLSDLKNFKRAKNKV